MADTATAALQEERKLKFAERERLEIEKLEQRIKEQTPARGSQLEDAANFDFFPLSEATKRGLQRGKFTKPTLIQTGAIPHALAGRDILAAAKTGSGKTLAFLIPILEKLYRSRWDAEDGLGALVISPTRELALQIFEVLRSVGKAHSFSAGLVIGGKNFKEEQYRLIRMNILICTPGRLLQHMEQTANFDPSNLQILVLDEADRILDMGFQQQLTSIVAYLPAERQTMLFSATQTKSVKDLAKLSLNEPEYIAVHEKSTQATPSGLAQSFVVCGLERKLDVLLSFIKSHLKQKTIVFLSTCRQVRFVHQVFCKLQPGVPLLALHGKYKQGKRVEIYYEFLNKPAAVLFATDIAARGLDFPQVDWVVQLDCPEDTANYIHRVGRTARYNKQGKALLTLLPSEVDGMTKAFEDAKIPIKEIKVNPAKTQSSRQKVTSVVAADKDIKALGQKAFMSYVRSVYLQPNREVFDASKLPLDEFALSYGLPGAPRMPFLAKMKEDQQEVMREELRGKKNVNRKLQMLKDKIKAEKERKRLEKQLSSLKKDKKQAEPSAKEDGSDKESDSDSDDGLMVVKRRHNWDKEDGDDEEEAIDLDASRKKKKAKKIRVDNEVSYNRVVFDDEGNSMKVLEKMAAQRLDDATASEFADVEAKSKQFQASVAARLREKDAEDRRLEKERVRAKHHKKRMKEKGERGDDDDDDAPVATLGSSDSSTEDGDEDMESSDAGSSDDASGSDEDDDSESEEEERVSKKKIISRDAVASQEELALRLLQKR
ncbi:Atp-dependent RNA helicase, partial [Globisporangium splendens]